MTRLRCSMSDKNPAHTTPTTSAHMNSPRTLCGRASEWGRATGSIWQRYYFVCDTYASAALLSSSRVYRTG